MHFQVYTSQQTARAWVYAYPTMHRACRVVDALAAVNSEPSTQQLMNDTSIKDAENALNWEVVVAYTQTVTPDNVDSHVPFTSYFLSKSWSMQGRGGSISAAHCRAASFDLRANML